MTLDKYLELVGQHTADYDRPASIRIYQRYAREHPDANAFQIHQYIQQMLPKQDLVSMRSVLEPYGDVSAYSIGRATKWIETIDGAWEETICGVYVTADVAQRLRAMLETAIPLQAVFEKECGAIGTEPTPAMFADFCSKYRQKLMKTRYHPYYIDIWYWQGEIGKLHELIRRWYMAYSIQIPAGIEGYLSVADAAARLSIKADRLLSWLWLHEDHYICHNGCCLVSVSTIQTLEHQWKNAQPVMALVKQAVAQLPTQARAGAQERVLSWLQEGGQDWILSIGTLPQQRDGVVYTTQPLVAEYAIGTVINAHPTLPIGRLKEITGMPRKQLQRKAATGAIEAVEDERGNWYISANEYRRVAAIHEQYITLDAIVNAVLVGIESKCVIGDYRDRDNLIDYCHTNDWWGMEYVRCDDLPMDGQRFGIAVDRDGAEDLRDRLALWLQCYGQSYDRQIQLVTQKYAHMYPHAVQQLIQFEQQVHAADKALVDMARLLFDLIYSDLQGCTETEIERTVVVPFSQFASLTSCDILADYLAYAGYSERRFRFERAENCMDVSAYPLQAYAVMVAHIVNDEVIQHGGLIQKAVNSKKYADLWLYVALHVYAAWRTSDYMRMIPPRLPYAPEEILERVLRGNLSHEEARKIAEFYIASNSLALNVPNKTRGTSGVPKLYFYCPQSCLETFGAILAIAAAHYQLHPESNTYVNPVRHWTAIKEFFGSEFWEACGKRSFSGRRANKALLQCIEYEGREGDQLAPTVAYHLASIIRSHKLTYGRLSETTDIYLRDAAFAGLTPEYVAYQMWDRGVCSFVTDRMFKMCYGDKYALLSESQKTKAIVEVGLAPAQIADLLRYVQHAEDCACEVIQSVCQSQETIAHALKSIAMGHGTGKDPEGFCLCKAAGKECIQKDRLNCMGCKYEIRTKALMLRYAVVHQSLLQTSDDMNSKDTERRKHLCKTVTYPAMQEILVHLNAHATAEEFKLYRAFSGEQNASAIWNPKEQRMQKRTLTRHRPETDCAEVGAVEKLTETEDQAQREEHFRLLASFG